jgi:hypothetical protein
MTAEGRSGTLRRRRLGQTRFNALPLLKWIVLLGATSIAALGADGLGADPLKTPTPDKPPTESKPRRLFSNFEGTELSDSDQREYLKLQLSLAEKNGKKTQQEIEELKKAIAELDERIAKGPSDSEMFALTLDKFLAFQRGEAKRHSGPNQPPWSFELNALIDALRSTTPRAKWFCQADFTLTPEHAALNLGGVKLGDLLPYAKKEVAHAPVAHQSHNLYLQALILTATNQEKDFTGDWLRYFERKNMEWEKGNFPGDLANLKRALKQPGDASGAARTSTADTNQVPARK